MRRPNVTQSHIGFQDSSIVFCKGGFIQFFISSSGIMLVQGTMLVEMNGTSSLPVAFDMNQGCPASDAWLLMRRVRSIAPAQTPQHPSVDPPKHPSLDPIDISP